MSGPRRRHDRPRPSPARAVAPPPPAARDPWAWASALAVLPVLLHSLGAPLGEPFADDFDYLHRVVFSGVGSFFDGGGSTLYWRPLGRQVYFGALSRAILSHPGAVVGLHVLLLGLASWLLYRAFRRAWPGPAAAAMASFPIWMESSRMLIAWPSHFMDLGALLFAALAIHEASRRRLTTALAAMLASLLCKEVGIVTVLLLPWVPGPTGAAVPGERRRWLVACGGLAAAWAVTYTLVSRLGGMSLPHAFEPTTMATPLLTRAAWAVWNSVRAGLSLAAAPGAWDGAILGAAMVVVVAAAIVVARRRGSSTLLPRLAWGAAWFLAASAALTEVYPAWAPYRAIYGGVGFGMALVALCDGAHPALLAALVALRLAAFALSPGPPARVTAVATERGDAFDFERLVRLERLVRGTRVALAARFPTLPPGARVGWAYLPRLVEYGYSGDKAVQVWYRDSTVRWIRSPDVMAHPEQPLTTIVEFEPDGSPQLALVEPAAMRRYLAGKALVSDGDYAGALRALRQADSLQRDRAADVFLGSVDGQRARALLGLDRYDEAEQAGRAGAARWRQNVFAQFVIACVRFVHGDLAGAEVHADSVLRFRPDDAEALALKARIRDARRGAGSQP